MGKCLIKPRRFQTILKWANFAKNNDDYRWIKCDENSFLLIKKEMARQMREQYKNYKLNNK